MKKFAVLTTSTGPRYEGIENLHCLKTYSVLKQNVFGGKYFGGAFHFVTPDQQAVAPRGSVRPSHNSTKVNKCGSKLYLLNITHNTITPFQIGFSQLQNEFGYFENAFSAKISYAKIKFRYLHSLGIEFI